VGGFHSSKIQASHVFFGWSVGQSLAQGLDEGIESSQGLIVVDDVGDSANQTIRFETFDHATDRECGLFVFKAGGLIRMQKA
jgi:hypothetical protein